MRIRDLASSIHIIHEDIDPKTLQEACSFLEWAQIVCFIGFGFHPLNLSRLAPGLVGDKGLLGTAMGFTGAELIPVTAALRGRVNLYRDYDGVRLLRETDVIHR